MTTCADLAVPDYVLSSGDRVLLTGTVTGTRGFDYSKCREIIAGATVSSATLSSTPSGLTLSAATVSSSGLIVSFTVTTGATEEEYCVTCLATLSTGAVIPMCGRFVVRAC